MRIKIAAITGAMLVIYLNQQQRFAFADWDKYVSIKFESMLVVEIYVEIKR